MKLYKLLIVCLLGASFSLSYGSQSNITINESLIGAAQLGHPSVVIELILCKADFNYSNEHGVTPLLSAISAKKEDNIKTLLEFGANPQLVSFWEGKAQHPLGQLVATANSLDIIQYFLKKLLKCENFGSTIKQISACLNVLGNVNHRSLSEARYAENDLFQASLIEKAVKQLTDPTYKTALQEMLRNALKEATIAKAKQKKHKKNTKDSDTLVQVDTLGRSLELAQQHLKNAKKQLEAVFKLQATIKNPSTSVQAPPQPLNVASGHIASVSGSPNLSEEQQKALQEEREEERQRKERQDREEAARKRAQEIEEQRKAEQAEIREKQRKAQQAVEQAARKRAETREEEQKKQRIEKEKAEEQKRQQQIKDAQDREKKRIAEAKKAREERHLNRKIDRSQPQQAKATSQRNQTAPAQASMDKRPSKKFAPAGALPQSKFKSAKQKADEKRQADLAAQARNNALKAKRQQEIEQQQRIEQAIKAARLAEQKKEENLANSMAKYEVERKQYERGMDEAVAEMEAHDSKHAPAEERIKSTKKEEAEEPAWNTSKVLPQKEYLDLLAKFPAFTPAGLFNYYSQKAEFKKIDPQLLKQGIQQHLQEQTPSPQEMQEDNQWIAEQCAESVLS